MIKVTNFTQISYPDHKQKINKHDTNLFKEKLSDALKENTTLNIDRSIPQPLQGVRPAAAIDNVTVSDQLIDNADQLLDLLDNYACDINNSEKTLKDINPKITAVRDKALKLMEEMNQKTSCNADLKEIVNQCALLANLEYIKFQRGDYI